MDTTFSTNREGYKLFVPLHKSSMTGRYEVSGLLFLATENQEYVQKGLLFFKQSLCYSPLDVGQRFHFLVDKDFSYLEVIRELFSSCVILLDDVHVDRYFREKVFPGSYNDDGSQPDKQKMLKAVVACRRSHTVEEYLDKRRELMLVTHALYVKPAHTKNPVLFAQYYLSNWDIIVPMWVYAYRKQMPLQGSGSTQACEAFFRVLKMYEKQQFGHRVPSLHEMIPKISVAINQRFLFRRLMTGNKRIKYYNPDPRFKSALEDASWCLNPVGMKLLHENFKLCQKRWTEMSIEDGGGVTERFEKLEAKTYQTTDEKCDCSYFHQMFYCRHIPFYRLNKGLPVFDGTVFHPSLTKDGLPGSGDWEDYTQISPPSPGMEMVLSEERRQRKNPSQSKKFNLSIDVGKELAEVMSTYETKTFEETLETTKNYVKAVRRGISEELKEYLNCPENFKIVPLVLHGQRCGEDLEPASQTFNHQVSEDMELVEETSCHESQSVRDDQFLFGSSTLDCIIPNSTTMSSPIPGNLTMGRFNVGINNMEYPTLDRSSTKQGRSTLTSSTADICTMGSATMISSTLTTSTEGISGMGSSNMIQPEQFNPEPELSRSSAMQDSSTADIFTMDSPTTMVRSTISCFTPNLISTTSIMDSSTLTSSTVGFPSEGISTMGNATMGFPNVIHVQSNPDPQLSNPQPQLSNPDPQQSNPHPQQSNPHPQQSSNQDSSALASPALASPALASPALASPALTGSTGGISAVGGRSASNSSNFSGGSSLVTGITSCVTCANVKCLAKRTPHQGLNLCSGCSAVAYCGRDCQREGWRAHNRVCKMMRNKTWNTKIKLVTLMIQYGLELNIECSQNQLASTDDDLPNIPYNPQSNNLREGESIQFLQIRNSKGRPQVKRQSKFKTKTKTMSEEVLDFFPRKETKDQPKHRKTRADKGKKRGSYKSENSEHLVKLRAPRAPKNIEALHREFGDVAAPQCGTCDLPLDFKAPQNVELQVVSCKKCKSFIHRSCEEFCVSCDNSQC